MALYFLPFQYLLWIGLGLGVIGTLAYIRAAELRKARRYIEEGEVALGRVLEMVKAPVTIYNGTPTTYAFIVRLEVPREDEKPQVVEVRSNEFSTGQKDRISTRFRVGDLVPVVWLPGKCDSSVQIYDFLEATYENSLDRSQTEAGPLAVVQLVASIAAIMGIFFALFWNLYAHGRYHPLDFDYLRQGWPPFALAGLLSVVGSLIALRQFSKKRLQHAERAAQAAAANEPVETQLEWGLATWALMIFIVFPGMILLGGLTLLCWCFTANALFDRSAAEHIPVEITEMTQTTHNFVLRHYDMKFRRMNEDKDHTLLTTPQHLEQFAFPMGAAVVRQGWLGWPWVETIEPAIVVE
jgi:hypothetical protein